MFTVQFIYLVARAGTGTRKPENPTRNCHYPTRPEQEILALGKTRPDSKPDNKPAGTRLTRYNFNYYFTKNIAF